MNNWELSTEERSRVERLEREVSNDKNKLYSLPKISKEYVTSGPWSQMTQGGDRVKTEVSTFYKDPYEATRLENSIKYNLAEIENIKNQAARNKRQTEQRATDRSSDLNTRFAQAKSKYVHSNIFAKTYYNITGVKKELAAAKASLETSYSDPQTAERKIRELESHVGRLK